MSASFQDRYNEELASKRKKSDLIKRELERRSFDEVLVFNPTDKDYHIKYGGYFWEIPNKNKDKGSGEGKAVLPRYVAVNYVKHMTDDQLNKQAQIEIEKVKPKYTGDYWAGEEERIGARIYKNLALQERWARTLWLGVHKKYGLDELPSQVTGGEAPVEKLNTTEDLIERIESGAPPLDKEFKPPENLIRRGQVESKPVKTSKAEVDSKVDQLIDDIQ